MQKFFESVFLTIRLFGVAIGKVFSEYADLLVKHLFEVERGQLKHVPNFVIFLIYVLCLSVIFQAGLDLVIETLMLTGVIAKIPLRVNFLFLTLISTVMGIQTLKGMSRRKLDVTRNSILIGIIVEAALIIGDVVLIYGMAEELGALPYIRLPFVMMTLMNFAILVYVAHTLRVFRNRRGELQLF